MSTRSVQAELDFQPPEPVDQVLQAHINSLVSALGGPDHSSADKPYVLGDEALACLKDIKRWIRGYDERMGRWDIARAISETPLVDYDLLEIITLWESQSENGNQTLFRHALACLEILVPLTWPLDFDFRFSTNNHLRHATQLERARKRYKLAVMTHPGNKVLKGIVRLALNSISVPQRERTDRDNGIIRLVLYFCRNIAAIEDNDSSAEPELGRSFTILEFQRQSVLDLVLTISCEMGSEFNVEDTIVLHVIFELCKGVKPDELFDRISAAYTKPVQELKAILSKEKRMRKQRPNLLNTRHSRFGTMVSLISSDEKRMTMIGQEPIRSLRDSMDAIDNAKKWNRPRRTGPKSSSALDQLDFLPPNLDPKASDLLQIFVNDFLDSGFNPLFTHVRQSILREQPRITESDVVHFFFMMGFFFSCERCRKEIDKKMPDFSLLSGCLNEETLITLTKLMDSSAELKDFRKLHAIMSCFINLVMMVYDMHQSKSQELMEIAEITLSRLFYEEFTLDLLARLPQIGVKVATLAFLETTTELIHVTLKVLEWFSKDNRQLMVHVRKNRRRKRKSVKAKTNIQLPDRTEDNTNPDGLQEGQNTSGNEEMSDQDEEGDSEEEQELEERERERSFDFDRFEIRFTNQSTVDCFRMFLEFYSDLDYTQIMRAMTYFHRVFVKRKNEIILFRMDFMYLLKMLLDPAKGLGAGTQQFKEVQRFMIHYTKRLRTLLQERPALFVEILFSKMSSSMFYLQHGQDETVKKGRGAKSSSRQVIAKMDFIKGDYSRDEQFAILISLFNELERIDIVDWVISLLRNVESEKRSWQNAQLALEIDGIETTSTESQDIFLSTDDDDKAKLFVSDGKLRLLLTLCDCVFDDYSETLNKRWRVPGHISADELQKTIDLIEANVRDPKILGKDAMSYFRTSKVTAGSDDDDDESGGDGEGSGDADLQGFIDRSSEVEDNTEQDFSAITTSNDSRFMVARKEDGLDKLGPKRKRKDKSNSQNKNKRRRRLAKRQQPLTDQEAAKRRAAQVDKELEKQERIRSSIFVHDSDDESDEERDKEFFAREEETRRRIEAGELSGSIIRGKKNASRPIPASNSLFEVDSHQSSLAEADSESEQEPASYGDTYPVEQDEEDERQPALDHDDRSSSSSSSSPLATSDLETHNSGPFIMLDEDEPIHVHSTQHNSGRKLARRITVLSDEEDD